MLLKSFALQPKKVVSVHFVDPSKMYKTGIKMPGLLQWLMRLSMNAYRKAAKKNGVEIIGQVTGADGQLLHELSEFVNQNNYIIKPYPTISIEHIERSGMANARVGTAIIFNQN